MLDVNDYFHFFVVITTLCASALIIFTLLKVELFRKGYLNFPYMLGWSLFVFIFLLFAFRPISYAFGDMGSYYNHFLDYQYKDHVENGDILFESMMFVSAHYLSAEFFFFACTALYFIPLYIAYKRFFKSYWPIVFILNTMSIDFYGFAVNGIRNGIAATLFLMALSLPKRIAWVVMLCSMGFHKSLALPTTAYIMASFYKNIKSYFLLWLLCFLVSVFYSGFGEMLQNTGLFSDKFDAYVDVNALGEYSDQFSNTGYRYDFLFYSLIPIMLGYYFIFIRKVQDPVYNQLLSIYLFCNAFWLLIIKASFSNRFAYLSWFMMALLIFYPIFYHYRSRLDARIFAFTFSIMVCINLWVNY